MHIKEVFTTKKNNLLNIYFTAGFPALNSMEKILPALEIAGVDMVEIGMPYSDPLSDGPTIQQSSAQAIDNGINTQSIFNQIANIQSNIPLIIMGYFNTIYQYGVEVFCKKCKAVGVSGLIVPDLPIELYLNKYQSIFEDNDISNIFLITPETSLERIHLIDKHSSSFIYAVSSSSTTGGQKEITDAEEYLIKLKGLNLQTPIMVGFNVSTKTDFDFVSNYAAGAIIGSAFIRHIKQSNDLKTDSMNFINSIKKQV